VVGPDSTFYAVWGDGNHIVFTTSRDGGRTFTRTRNIIDTAPIMFTIEALSRTNGFPQIAIDPRGDAKGGRLYVTWSDYRNGDVDVFCSTSANHGKSWSPAVRVNSDAVHNGEDQFFQWLAVDPSDGSADVVFYDRRADPQNRNETVTLARSTDAGQTFQNYAWTTQAFDATGVFLGDYTGLAALNGRVYGIWTERPQSAAQQPRTGERPPQPPRGSAEYWKLHGAIIRIGVADLATPPARGASKYPRSSTRLRFGCLARANPRTLPQFCVRRRGRSPPRRVARPPARRWADPPEIAPRARQPLDCPEG
jgi:hypothetical protein